MARLLATFQVEADEHLDALRRHLLELAGAASPDIARELVQTTFRDMHTLKGAARSVGQRDVERVCASCEALLSALTRAGTAPSAGLVALLEEATAAIGDLVAGGAGTPVPNELLERLDRACSTRTRPTHRCATPLRRRPPSPRRRPSRSPAPWRSLSAAAVRPATIRLATDDLDTLLRRGEELLSIKLAADEWLAGAEALHEQLRRAAHAEDPLAEIKALEAGARGRWWVGCGATGGRSRARSTALLEQAQRVRMMPASSVLDLLPLMVRDLARAQGKQVQFSATGGDARIDRRVLEAIKDPLIHMIRNAVDHGLETPEERVAAGKAPQGAHHRRRAAARGRPRRVRALRRRARDRPREGPRRRPPRADRGAADEDPLALVFRSGLSTSFVITDVSGHGLGLAIVKDQVDQARRQRRARQRPRRRARRSGCWRRRRSRRSAACWCAPAASASCSRSTASTA